MCSLVLIRITIALIGALSGATLIGMGIGYYHNQNDLTELFKDVGITHPKIIVLALGIIIFIMSLMSLLSAVRNTLVGKLIYCAILGLIIAFLVITAVMIFTKHANFKEESGKMFDSIWNNRKKDSAVKFLDKVNQYFHCCGSKSSNDYFGLVPQSCCDVPINNVCDTNSIYTNGCRKAIINYTTSKADLIGSIAIVTAVVLSIVVISSFI